MDSLTFISKLVEFAAWPLVALILGLTFRQKLLELLTALRRLKAGPLEAEFDLAAKQALADSEEAKVFTAASSSRESTEAGVGIYVEHVIDKLRETRGDPTGSVLRGWAKLDAELFLLGEQIGLGFSPVESQYRVYQSLLSSGALPPQVQNLVMQLHELRNSVAHNVAQPTVAAAQDYVLAVDRAVEFVRAHRSSLSQAAATASRLPS